MKIDYHNHPAYVHLDKSFYLRVKALSLFVFAATKVFLRRIVRYEQLPQRIRAKTYLHALTYRFILNKSIEIKTEQNSPSELKLKGFMTSLLSPKDTAHLEEKLQPFFDRLVNWRLERLENGGGLNFADSRLSISEADNKELFMYLQSILEDTPLYKIANTFKGRELAVVDISPQINEEADDFWRVHRPSANLDDDTGYFHTDSSGGDLKVIIYLSNVKEVNGPFEYVSGSNNWNKKKRFDLIGEVVDSSPLAGQSENAKKLFANLPHWLQFKGSYGNDIIDSSNVKEIINENKNTFVSPKGTMILFDTKGLHRGGMVKQGMRKVVTIVLG